MVTTAAPPALVPAGAPAGESPLRRRFTVAEYQQMGEAGIFAPDERVELLAGEIFRMAALGIRHGKCVDELTERIILQLGIAVRVRTQGSFYLADGSQPEPDVLVLRRQADNYGKLLPKPEDVLLLIEVSDTTLAHDRKLKLPLYAAAGIAEVWIVNLVEEVIEVYTAPVAGSYTSGRIVQRGESLTPVALPDLVLAVTDVLL